MRRILQCALAVVLFTSCSSGGEEARSEVLGDSSISFDEDFRPTRIVSLLPAVTEILFSLGAGDLVVGRTRWCDAPPEAVDVPSVGDGLEPNVEVILAQRPDLVIFYSAAANEPAINQIKQLGVNTLSIRIDGISDLAGTTTLLGRVTGHQTQADSLISNFNAEIQSLRETRPSEQIPRALILSWDNPPIIIGAGSFLSELVELAGAMNVFDDVDRPSLRVSIESIVDRDPDVILIASDSSLVNRVDRPEWRVVPAIREQRFLMIEGNEFSRPTFRMPSAISKLRIALEDWR